MFDGPDHISPLIGTYCGQQRNLVIFSSGSTLLLTFSTLQRIADTQNRGFMGIFNFSESYVKLGKLYYTRALSTVQLALWFSCVASLVERNRCRCAI